MEMQSTRDRKVKETGFRKFWWNCPGFLRWNSICIGCRGRDRWYSILSTSTFSLSRIASVCYPWKSWSFSFHHGNILENPSFGVVVLDIQSQACIFCFLKCNWPFPSPKPTLFPLCFFCLAVVGGWETNAKCSLQQFDLWAQNTSPCCICFHKASKNWLLLLRDVLEGSWQREPTPFQPRESKKPWALLYLC